MKKIQLENQVFGYLTALRYKDRAKWECICSCGNKVVVMTRQLSMGHVTSCGCQPPPKRMVAHDDAQIAVSVVELLAKYVRLTSAEIAEHLNLHYQSTDSLMSHLCRKKIVRFVSCRVVRAMRKWRLSLPVKLAIDAIYYEEPTKCKVGQPGSHEITNAGLTEEDDLWMQHYRAQYQNRYLRVGLTPPITKFV
jgi:hypothetical protein